MCLSPEFFDARDALIRKREAEGDIELEHFLEDRVIEIDRLYDLSLLKDERDFMTTADLFVHQVTAKGRRFLNRMSDHQLIFVRRNRVQEFSALLDGVKNSLRPSEGT